MYPGRAKVTVRLVQLRFSQAPVTEGVPPRDSGISRTKKIKTPRCAAGQTARNEGEGLGGWGPSEPSTCLIEIRSNSIAPMRSHTRTGEPGWRCFFVRSLQCQARGFRPRGGRPGMSGQVVSVRNNRGGRRELQAHLVKPRRPGRWQHDADLRAVGR